MHQGLGLARPASMDSVFELLHVQMYFMGTASTTHALPYVCILIHSQPACNGSCNCCAATCCCLAVPVHWQPQSNTLWNAQATRFQARIRYLCAISLHVNLLQPTQLEAEGLKGPSRTHNDGPLAEVCKEVALQRLPQLICKAPAAVDSERDGQRLAQRLNKQVPLTLWHYVLR